VDCACFVDKKIHPVLTDKGLKIHDIPFSRNPLDPKNLKAFHRLIQIQKEHQYDLIHVHTPIAALYGRLLKIKFPNLKTVYTAHGFHFYKGAPLTNWLIYYPIERIMAKFTDTIITMNQEDYERALTFKISQTHKINGVGVNLEEYKTEKYSREEERRALGIKESDFVILMIAEVNENKNHKQMIDAIELIKDRKDIKVLCAGTGNLFEKIEQEIKMRKLDEQIKMLGYRTDINHLITACDIGMLLSYREGLPRSIMEFMAYGKPVIGTNIRGIKDLIGQDNAGILVKVGDSIATANAIERLADEEILYKELSRNALQSVQKYDLNLVLNQLANIMGSKKEISSIVINHD
jgi:glycosyltransferase involved in cell wall biosynthesis